MITSSEWEVMRVVWSHDKVTSSQIHKILEEKLHWKIATVKTLLSRLAQKNYLSLEKSGRSYLYSSLITEEDAIQDSLETSLSRICQTKRFESLLTCLDKEPVTKHMLEELEVFFQKKQEDTIDSIRCTCLKGQCRCKGGCHDL